MQPMSPTPSRALPKLRQELSLQPGQNAADGSPTWTLHDPASNRFYQLGWPAFEILARWSLGNAADIVSSIQRETTLRLSSAEVESVAEFLVAHHLARARSAEDTARLLRAQQAGRAGPWSWLLHHYLFFRIPLIRPERFLQRTAALVSFAYQPRFWWLMAVVALVGLFLVAQRWDNFVGSFTAYSGWQGLLGIGIALSCTKVLHELGHAYTAHRHGCRVPAMGAAFLVLWPVLYTDTNEAWKVASRNARLQIGAAGMAAELALAACATLLWSFLPDGPLRAGVFLLSTSTWIITLAVNLSPFMRFDGYFLLSDLLNTPNLHERAFAFGRWHLREWLFGLGAPEPEAVGRGRRRFLIAFAWATWIYRVVLFFGIALLVYHLFFKLLGLLLLCVELGWFIVLPLVREVRAWWERRAALSWNSASRRSAALAVLLLAVLLVPTGGKVRAPAMLQAARDQMIYAAAASQVQRVLAGPGAQVRSGQLLLELVSPDLQAQLALAQAQEQQLRWQLEQQSFDTRLQSSGTALRTRWEAAHGAVSGVQALIEQLQVRAPFDGRLAGDHATLHPGTWIAKSEAVLQIVAPAGVRVTAFIEEPEARRLPSTLSAKFIADQPGLARLECRTATPDRINITALEFPALTSVFGGPIASTGQPQHGESAVKPLVSLLRVRIADCEGISGVVRELPGVAILEATRESIMGRATRAALALWRREGGW
jgi:putative peptide zinc metalloprotease protein